MVTFDALNAAIAAFRDKRDVVNIVRIELLPHEYEEFSRRVPIAYEKQPSDGWAIPIVKVTERTGPMVVTRP